jgi:hypothetical protein
LQVALPTMGVTWLVEVSICAKACSLKRLSRQHGPDRHDLLGGHHLHRYACTQQVALCGEDI